MDYRRQEFLERFNAAKKLFEIKILKNIISVKFRENCVHSSDYHELVEYLKHTPNISINSINVNRSAWLVEDKNNNRIIVFEHETGLELLYIAGSIASLISLIPLICNAWNCIGDRFRRYRYHNDIKNKTELRKFNNKEELVEQQIDNIETFVCKTYISEQEKLEKQIKKLKIQNKKLKDKQKRSQK
ncbi:MAG: hypothetical protein LHV68_13210 [Elusimicrobia bacterium]|nr:hypothetical protein [Candidatus Liberimonas magnetica]